MAKRDFYFDNLKMVLIVLVVLAHGMEIISGPVLGALYSLIYLFHMPAFIFVTGYFTKKQSKIKIGNLFIQYLIFQTLYLFFMGWLNGVPVSETTFFYTTPFWILWFTFAAIFWKMVAPYITRMPKTAVITITVVWALVAGFIPDIGYAFSASRISVFLPFFILGYLVEVKHIEMIRKIPFWVGCLTILISYFLIQAVKIPVGILYGSLGYAAMELPGVSGAFWRLLAMGWGMVLVVSLMACIPSGKIILATSLGANTLQVYYLHAFVLKWAAVFVPAIVAGMMVRKILFFLALLIVTFILASKPIRWIFWPLLNPVYFIKKAGESEWFKKAQEE